MANYQSRIKNVRIATIEHSVREIHPKITESEFLIVEQALYKLNMNELLHIGRVLEVARERMWAIQRGEDQII